NNQIALSWTPVVGVSNYDLLRSTDGLNFSAVASGYASTSFVDSGVFNGNLYFYKIVANFASVSTTSSMSSAYTPGITPLSPKNIQAKSNNVSGEVVLTWDAVAGVSKYNVYQSTSSGSYSLPINTTSSNSGFLVNGLNLGTTYYFVVTALNGELESSFSSEASIQHELQTTAPSINWSSISSLSIDWNDIAGASTYEVLRSVDRIYWETLATGLVSSDYVDSTLDVNTTYFYRYRSVNSAAINMSLSDISEEANLSLIPLSPVNLYANATDTSSVLLNWTASPQSSNYEIFRSNTAGGPYVSLSVVNAANTSYLDGSVFSGNSYFYVVKALNTINTPSASSNEASINLNTTPVNLLASNVSGGIQLNWDSMIGVSGYRILRSEKSGGPYGQVGVVVTNSFLDTTVLGGETYFYVIVGEYSNGAISPYSNEANLNKLGEVNLQVVIELIDLRLSSSSLASQVFEKSQTSFDTSAYDGVASYEFEILSSNIDSSSRNIYLVDSSDSAIATISVPAGTSEVTRFRVTATPNLGSDVYRIRVSQTTSDDQLVIHGAKLLVNQVNATKTKLYFPLLSVKGGASHTDTTGFSFSTNLQSYQNINHRISFQREVDHLKTIADYNAWEIETIVSTSGGAEGIMALYNEEESANVATTETRFDQSSLVLNRIPLDEGVVGFSSINNGDHYSIKMMCEFNCGAGQVILYKAGLWVKLENLSSAIVQYRLASSQDPEGSVLQKYQDRVIIDATKFSTPTIYFRTDLVDYPGSTADVLLQSHGDDYGTSGLVDAPGSALYFDLDSRGTLLSGPLSLSSGDRFTTKLIPNGGMVELFSTSILVYAAPP
ncbi:MAG: fibronectin type III domain-containing protein, partial [Bdellovibrionales bacterium]|nr:fibronectin type III domain-containing protein [Bdellovibrionales bacterium]